MRTPTHLLPLVLSAAALVLPGRAQVFTLADAQIPQGAPSNASSSENVDFGDVDLDGDFDALFADGGDCCNDQNRLWINLGGLQGGTIGFFEDQTATRFPAVVDASRDIELADYDGDGDLDVSIANHSSFANQANRFWTNVGGLQAGTAGFFVDETATRWVGVGGPGSSVWPNQVLSGGGFFDYSPDTDFGDLDNDGDLDLVHVTYGPVYSGSSPTRLFLNDGSGKFTEFNPSGFQLGQQAIVNGDPALWAEGVQQASTTNTSGLQADIAMAAVDVDLGDIDGDFDLDLLHGDRNTLPRFFQNRLQENGGVLGWRDVTSASFAGTHSTGGGNYEQELGDLDGDDDLDIYGLNWGSFFEDRTFCNDGQGFYLCQYSVPTSNADEEEVDFGDYDGDGHLDAFVANFSGQDRLKRNPGSSTFLVEATSELPSYTGTARDADWCDVDADGDPDVVVVNTFGAANRLLINGGGTPDTFAPRVAQLEQAPDRVSSALPTVVRCNVYDNAAYYVTWYAKPILEFRVDGGIWYALPMRSSAGQVFRGELPGAMIGTVEYRVRVTDLSGNQGLSQARSYTAADGGCNGSIATYCTAKVPSLPGCAPAFSFNGVPSASALTGFTVQYGPVPGGNPGLFIYTTKGAAGTPIQNAFGWLCVQAGPGLFRIGLQSGGGSNGQCNGGYGVNFNQHIAMQTQNPDLVEGATVDLQVWYRDPPNPGTANLSDAARFTVCP